LIRTDLVRNASQLPFFIKNGADPPPVRATEAGSNEKATTKESLSDLPTAMQGNTKGKSAKIWSCKVCEEKFRKKKDMRSHQAREHSTGARILPPTLTEGGKWRWKCSMCHEEMRSRRRIKGHLFSVHSMEKYCMDCGQVFPDLDRLMTHKAEEHFVQPDGNGHESTAPLA